jgi:hypothetical protein
MRLQIVRRPHQARGVKTTKVKASPQSPSRTASLSHPKGAAMASRDFQQELHAQIERAIERGAEQLIVNSGELLAAVGGRPVLKHQMRYCCDVMREKMKAGDAVVDGPENGNGPSLTIRYLLSGSSERG